MAPHIITGGGKFFGPSRIARRSVAPAAAWTPANITTLGWWDASDETTITESAGKVSQIDDLSGNDNHMLQGTGANQPATGTLTINSLNTLSFDNQDAYMENASNPFGATVNDFTVFQVIRTLAINVGVSFDIAGATYVCRAYTPYSDGKFYFDVGAASAPNRISVASGISVGNENIVSFTNQTGLQEIRKNGTQVVADATGHSASTNGGIVMGSRSGFKSNRIALGEMIVINGSLTETNRQLIEGYLAHKWGLAANLPSGHPYKSAAP